MLVIQLLNTTLRFRQWLYGYVYDMDFVCSSTTRVRFEDIIFTFRATSQVGIKSRYFIIVNGVQSTRASPIPAHDLSPLELKNPLNAGITSQPRHEVPPSSSSQPSRCSYA